MDPYVFDVLHRERLRERVEDFHLRQWRDQATKAPGSSRGAVRLLFARVRTRFAQVLGSMSAKAHRAPVASLAHHPGHGRDE